MLQISLGSFVPSFIFVVDARFFGDDLGRYVYQHEVKLGWSSVPTCFGGSIPLQGDSSSSKLGFLSIFEASDSSLPGDAMVSGHLLWLGRSALIVHVGYDMLLKTATKNYVSSPEKRGEDSSDIEAIYR